jgi:hypothetical protein
MSLSIDEAESRCTQTESVVPEKDKGDAREWKPSRGKFQIFMESLQNYAATRSGEKLPKLNN